MKILINYADITYREAQKYCTKMAYSRGKFDTVIEYSPSNIPKEFKEKNKKWFTIGDRQIGKYGLWRPYIISDALSQINNGDYLCYCDSGAYFIRSVDYLITSLRSSSQDIMLFESPLKEYQWTKDDVFRYFDCEKDNIKESNQIISTFFIIKKSDFTVQFFAEYLLASENMPSLFTDEDNVLGGENHELFIQNRHNQSVLSVLGKKYGLYPFKDPSDYGVKSELYSLIPGVIYEPHTYENSNYPMILISHRYPSVNFKTHILNAMRLILPPCWYIGLLTFGRRIRNI